MVKVKATREETAGLSCKANGCLNCPICITCGRHKLGIKGLDRKKRT